MRTSTLPPPQAQWYLIDASGLSLGRLAARVAFVIRGKHHPSWTPHQSFHDHVVVVNAAAVRVGKSAEHSKVYKSHSGHVGRMKSFSVTVLLSTSPENLLKRGVQGMLPANRLRKDALRRLHVYSGSDHPHARNDFLPLPAV